MNVLIATNNCHLPQQYGGSEISIDELALTFREIGVDVRVICGLKSGGKYYYFNRLKSYFIDKKFPSDNILGYMVYRGWISGNTIINGFEEVLKNYVPDIIIVQGSNVLQLAQEICVFKIPMLISFIDVEVSNLKGVLPNAANVAYCANSTFTANRIFDKFGARCKVIQPLVKVERYFTETTRKYVTLVNPHPFKGSELVIELAKINPQIPFIFQESWPLTEEYKAKLKMELAGISNIEYREPTMDMKSLYAVTKILLVPSQYEEAWGRVVNEAQISGIPVIASNKGGLPESVGNGGLVISYEAPIMQWSDALNDLWNDLKLYNEYASKAYERMQIGELSSEYLIRQYQLIFEEIKSKMKIN